MYFSELTKKMVIVYRALLHFRTPLIVIDDSSWKNAAESFTVALTLTLRGVRKCNSADFSVLNFDIILNLTNNYNLKSLLNKIYLQV